jgi:hypothetical protein
MGKRVAGLLVGTLLALAGSTGCTFVGEGEGAVRSESLTVPDCWFGAYDLEPDFFAAVPYRDTMQIRVQRGNDLQEVSDGLAVLINEVSTLRPRACTQSDDCGKGLSCVSIGDGVRQCMPCADGSCAAPNQLGQPLQVGLPPQLLDEIAPGVATGAPPPVSLALYLQFSCHNQNRVLYAIGGTITFSNLFNGNPNESSGAEKFTDAEFDVIIADPRDALPGTLEVPEELTSRLTGFFRFHFQRGQPGQPFP